MKNWKKMISILLVLMMVFGLTVTAQAAEEKGTITIENPVEGQTYTIYRILDLESYDAAKKAYSYKASEKWSAFINSVEIKEVYVTVDESGYVKWKNENVQTGSSEVVEFGNAALEYAKDNSIANDGQVVAGNASVVFSELPLGYYLIDSTVGTLCVLNTAAPDITVAPKNTLPVSNKKVKEDSSNYADANDADIFQTIEFMCEITIGSGAQNYILHDKMSEGLTFNGVTEVTDEQGTPLTLATDYTVKTNPTDGCTFHVEIAQAYLDKTEVRVDDKIILYYTGELNKKAVIGNAGNPNEFWLSYGENHDLKTTPKTTVTKTWGFDILKYTEIENVETALADAHFLLKYLKTSNNKMLYAMFDTTGKFTGWTYNKDADNILDADNDHILDAEETETVDKNATTQYATVLISNAEGKIHVEGLDSGTTYFLEEIKAPNGYNIIKNDGLVIVDEDGGLKDGSGNPIPNNLVKIVNNAGSLLPTTGGMGTTILYTVGAILMIGAAILLIAKRKMKVD